MAPTSRPEGLLSKAVFIVVFFVLAGFDCFGQAARPNRGVMPTGSYAISDIENINVTNGNLNISIPLASLPPMAGGKLGFTVRAEYNSKGWDTVREELQLDPLDPATKYVVSHLQQSGVSGWRVGGTYQISFEDITWDYSWLPPPPNDPEYSLLTQNRWSKVMLMTPDGATHELRPVDYNSYADVFSNHNYLRGYYKDDPNTANTALRYYSYDGSHLWAKIDPSPYLYAGAVPNWVIYLPDGTRVEQANGIQRIIDTNGNKVKIWTDGAGTVWTTHYQDEQTGREIKYVYDSAGNGGQGLGQVQYQTVGGTWVTITLNFGTTHVFGKTHAVNDPECGDPSVLIDTEIAVVRSIVFPQTEPGQPARQLAFSYNSDTTDTVNVQWHPNCAVSYQTITSASHGWGSLSRIVLASGAIIDYAYSFDGQTSALFDPDDVPRENLISKTITHDSISEIWTYGVGPDTSGVTSPDGSFVTEKRYPSDPAFSHNYSGFGGKESLVYRTNYSDKTLVERQWSLMIFSGGDNIAPGASVQVAFNPVVDAEYTTLLDDTPAHNPLKMSARTFQYDYNGNLLSQTDYDWFDPALVSRDAQGVPTGVPASATILRVTNNSYYNQATTASSANVYAKRSVATATPLILNALQQGTVGPSIVQLSYDGQAYGVAPTVGNLTSKKVWVDLDSKWITASNTYGLYGNLATSTDGRGKVTQFF